LKAFSVASVSCNAPRRWRDWRTNSFSAFWRSASVFPSASVSTPASERSSWAPLAQAELFEVEPDAFQDVEAVVDAGQALLDLDLVLRQRLDAGAKRRFAAGFELVDAFGEALMAETQLADQGIEAGVRRAQRHQLGVGLRQIFLVLVQGREGVLDLAHPRQQRRHVARDVLEPVGEVVRAVFGLEVVQRAFELVLAVADLGEDGLDRAALIGDLADHLAQGLLAAADLGELVVHVGGFVAAPLEQRTLLGLAQLVMEGGDGLPGIALDQVLDGGVEVVLQGMGDDDVLAGLLEAVAQIVEATVLAREPPGGGADQCQRQGQDRAGRNTLRDRQASEPEVADLVTERLLGEDRDGGEQNKPGNQEKQPHRDFLTPAHYRHNCYWRAEPRSRGGRGRTHFSGAQSAAGRDEPATTMRKHRTWPAYSCLVTKLCPSRSGDWRGQWRGVAGRHCNGDS